MNAGDHSDGDKPSDGGRKSGIRGGGEGDANDVTVDAPTNTGVVLHVGADENIYVHPIYYYTSIFLMVTTLLQIIATSIQDDAGPLDWFSGILIPQIASTGVKVWSVDRSNGVEDEICPPDQWIDPALEQMSRNGANSHYDEQLYSTDHDPRSRMLRPTLFPHCALKRWVRMQEEHSCPLGEEYATIIRPPNIAKHHSATDNDNKADGGRIPKMLHVSSPTNCIPKSTLEALQQLTQEHIISQAYTIYIHSSTSMDNFIFSREWDIFPEVKEGILCGMGKLNAATLKAVDALNVGNSTEDKQHIADVISLGVKRDLWRYMVLWEYGGVTMDIDALHTILSAKGTAKPAGNSTNGGEGYNTMRKLMHQWSTETSGALLYFINNVDKQHLPYVERIPLTDIMGMVPYHPLIYYSAKEALRITLWDGDKSVTDTGRTTKVPPIKEGLKQVNRSWRDVKTGEVLRIESDNKHSVHFVDGDIILPEPLSSPRISPWKSIFNAIKSSKSGSMPSEDDINAKMRQFAAEQKYIGPDSMFSCMEYRLNMYLQKGTE